MTLTKRLLSVLLTVCMIVAMVPAFAVSADDVPSVSFEATVEEGSTEVTVFVYATGSFGEEEKIDVEYDPDIFTFAEALNPNGDDFSDADDFEITNTASSRKGYFITVIDYIGGDRDNEPVGTVTFEVAEGVEVGTYEFYYKDTDEVAGTVTIEKPPYEGFTLVFSADKTEVTPGDTFTVTYKLYNIPEQGFTQYQFYNLFDGDAFAFTAASVPATLGAGGLTNYGTVNMADYMLCGTVAPNVLPDSKLTIGQATFTVKEAAVNGEYTVTQDVSKPYPFTSFAYNAPDGTQVELGAPNVVPAVITVTGGSDPVTECQHETKVTIPGYPATCTETGLTDGEKCAVCEEILVPQEVIPATGHTPVVVDEIPATCTEDGNTGYTYCSVCNEILEGENTVIPASGHVPVEVSRIEPTCTEFGHTAYTYCSVCNEILEGVNEVIPATGHTFGDGVVTTDPTCTEPGVTTFTCACGESYTEEIKPLGHVPVVVDEVPATCTVDGATAYTYCSVCFETLEGKSSVIPALGHDYVAVVTPPTAEEGGYTTYSCSRCEDSYVTDYTDPTGHHYGPGVVTVEPGCTDTGVMTYTCTDEGCGKSYTEVIDALGHAPVEVPAIAETCTVDGHTAYTYCSRCEEILEGEDTVIPAPGHLEAEKFEVEPTCTKPGHSGYVFCLVCGEILGGEDVVYPPTGHTEVIVNEVAPTCTEPGHTGYVYCSECYEVLGGDDKEIPATGHTPVTVDEIAPTCTVGGHTGFTYCSVCEEIIEGTDEPISALGHQEAEVFEIAPTCTEPGRTGYVFCLRCNEILYGEDVEIPATGHTPVTVPGYPATCTEFGLTDGSKCSVCEATIVPGMLIPPTGHHYVDGVCEDCGDVMKSGWIVLENGDVAYFDAEGVRDTNFSNDGLYYTVEGETLKQWQEIDGNTYYFKKAAGEKLTGLQFVYWVLYDFGEFGICENADGYTGTYDHVYYVDGAAYTGFAEGSYYVKGRAQTGWLEVDGDTYYASITDKKLITGIRFVAGVLYEFTAEGVCLGEYTGTYNHVYYVDGVAFTGEQNGTYYEGGRKQTGWIVTEDGTIYVSTTSGNKLVGMKYVKGILYEFDENGICQDVNGYTGYYKWSNGSANFVNGVIA